MYADIFKRLLKAAPFREAAESKARIIRGYKMKSVGHRKLKTKP